MPFPLADQVDSAAVGLDRFEVAAPSVEDPYVVALERHVAPDRLSDVSCADERDTSHWRDNPFRGRGSEGSAWPRCKKSQRNFCLEITHAILLSDAVGCRLGRVRWCLVAGYADKAGREAGALNPLEAAEKRIFWFPRRFRIPVRGSGGEGRR